MPALHHAGHCCAHHMAREILRAVSAADQRKSATHAFILQVHADDQKSLAEDLP